MTAQLTLAPDTQDPNLWGREQSPRTTVLTDDEVRAFKTFIEYLHLTTARDMTDVGRESLKKMAWLFRAELID